MKKWIKTLLCAAVTAGAIALLTGCMRSTADELYALPQLSEEYLQLQGLIDKELNSGAEYAAPASGSNRQAVQLEDIDGDGIREAIVFFNFIGSDRPLKIYVYRQDAGGDYQEALRIEGEGSGVESISYIDMDGDGIKEIAVGWQIASGINMMSVYSVKGLQVTPIINTDYTQYVTCDMGEEPGSDLVVLRAASSDPAGEAFIYSLAANGEVITSSARLTDGVADVFRVRTTGLADGRQGVFVESALSGGGIVTDVLAFRDGKLVNVTMDETTGRSEGTVRTYEVYCRDINGDGLLDVPVPVALPAVSESTTFYMIDWYTYASDGEGQRIFSTYSNYTDSWYLILPEEWRGEITVRRTDGVSGERAIVFSRLERDGTFSDFLIIYTLTGENRAERATYGSRFVLLAEEETIYAAAMLEDPSGFDLPLSEELIRSSFRIIYSEWITGET